MEAAYPDAIKNQLKAPKKTPTSGAFRLKELAKRSLDYAEAMRADQAVIYILLS